MHDCLLRKKRNAMDSQLDEDNVQQELVKVELHSFFEIAGSAFFLVWIVLLCMPVMTSPGMGVTELLYFRICAVFGNLLMSVFAYLVWSRLYSTAGTVAMLVCCIFFAPLPVLCVLINGVPVFLCFVCWFLAGVASACFILFWGSSLSYHKHKKALIYPAVVAIVIACLMLCTLLMPSTALLVFIASSPILSTFLFILERRYASPKKKKSVLEYFPLDSDLKPSSIKDRVMPSIVGTFVSSLLLGFVIYYFLNADSPFFLICVFLTIVTASAFRIYDSLTKERYEIKQDIKFIGLVAGIGFLPLVFIGGTGWPTVAALSFVMLISFLNHLVGWTAIAEFTRVNELPPYWNFASGRLGNTAGLAAGFICGYLTFGPEVQASLAIPYIPSAIVLFLILVQAFILKDGYSPLFTGTDGFIGFDGQGAGDRQVGIWQKKRLMFANTYNLSPRETEVMILIVKGYNAKHVQERLSISDHTVRAHIYNIYRKADVHSKQELIDLIENSNFSEK